MGKNQNNLVKKPLFYVIFSLILFLFCSGCVNSCKIRPDYEKIGDSALKNKENLMETNLKSGKVACNF
jgi:hypothetical protein|tara:strand:- start:323 stop:526 length:204 start_codon:yes stop_codon:yes gene_type:complete